MSEKSTAEPISFALAAKSVQHRLVLRKALLWLLQTWPYAAGGLVLLALLRVLGVSFIGLGVALLGLVAWALGCLAWAFRKMPKPYAAFSFWDRATQRSDAFANAWWFESQAQRSLGEQLHLDREAARLPKALLKLKADIVLPEVRKLSALPVCALALLLLPTGDGLHFSDPALTAEGKRLASAEGKKLAEKKIYADKIKTLSEDEKKEIEKLQNKVQETANSLQQDNAKSTREVLAELEKQAHDAERMADKLGSGDAAWASEQMVAEMRKHTDTADIGDAVANKNTEATAQRALEMADKLLDTKLSHEVRDRLAETFKDIAKQAQAEDKERTVGGHVLKAETDLAQTLQQEAGKEFQALADKMKTLAQREKAREELEKLAQQLRESGSNIAGQGQQGMQQLAGNQGQQGQQGQGAQNGQQQQQQMTAMQNAPQSQPMQMPGSSNAPQSQGQQGTNQQMQMLQQQQPGEGKESKNLALKPSDGKSDGNKDKPMLFAPIPPQPGEEPDAMIMGTAPGSSAGSQAGNTTAEMGKNPTQHSKSTQQATVNAQRNADGASSVRTIEGKAHDEQSARSSQATALEAIGAEENALDDSALPSARREQVRRYFTELRKRFEKQN